MNKKTIGSIALILVLLVAGFFGYQAYFSDSPVTEIDGSGATEAGEEILATLQSTQDIQFNGQIFSNPDFLSLIDPSVRIESGLIGRPNPFNTIGEDNLSLLENPNQMAEDSQFREQTTEQSTEDSATATSSEEEETTPEENTEAETESETDIESNTDQTEDSNAQSNSEEESETSQDTQTTQESQTSASSESEANEDTETSASNDTQTQEDTSSTDDGSFGGGSDGPPPPPAVPQR